MSNNTEVTNTDPGPRVLVVEDHPLIAELIETQLTAAGFRVDKCLRPREAIDQIDRERYDIAILDIMMPEIDGYQVLAHIRSRRCSTQDVLVVLLSARSSQADIEKGLEMGADLYITKPFNGAELVRTLTLLSRAGRSRKAVLEQVPGARR
jgi:DNA-binding response OmpR family regulator